MFYAALLRSPEILFATVETEYSVPAGDASGSSRQATLLELFNARGDTRGARIEMAARALNDRLSVGVERETGVVSLSVTTKSAALSQQIASRMLELVNDFNLKTRQSQAAAERRFISGRLGESALELSAAEDSLQSFLQQNRRYENSPELTFEFDRLERRVALRQQIYTTLSEAYEEARIDEVRNTPVITIVEQPKLAARRDPRRLVFKALLGLILGGIVGLLVGLLRDAAERARRDESDSYDEFMSLGKSAVGDVRSGLRRARRVIQRREPTTRGAPIDQGHVD